MNAGEQDPKSDSITQQSIKKRDGYSNNWALGLAIIVIGGLLLARNLGYELFFLNFHNWWAFFIMLAAIGPLQQAYSSYRKEGLDSTTANSLISAGTIVFISLLFLLDLAFGVWWPVFVIFAGAYMMTSNNKL